MAFENRTIIGMFAELLLPPPPDAMKDINNINHYKPKEEIINNWTVILEKDEKKSLCLDFPSK